MIGLVNSRTGEVRQGCLVPFCRRTRKPGPPGSEWICGPHWRLTGPWSRRKLRTIRRLIRRGDKTPGLEDVEARLWERLRGQAIERAAGI